MRTHIRCLLLLRVALFACPLCLSATARAQDAPPASGEPPSAKAAEDIKPEGHEVLVPRKLLWRIESSGYRFQWVKPPADAAAKTPKPVPGTLSGAPPTAKTDAPSATGESPTGKTPVPTLFTAQIDNESAWDLSAVLLELQITDKDGERHSVRRVVTVRDSVSGKRLPAFAQKDFSAPANFPADILKGRRGYWIIVRGARGVPFLYDADPQKALFEAVPRDDVTKAEEILQAHPALLASVDPTKHSLLEIAAIHDSADVALALLKRGIAPDGPMLSGLSGESPLWMAIQLGGTRTTRVLIEGKANVNFRRAVDGATLLHLAVEMSDRGTSRADTSAIELLLKNHADPNVKNKMGQYPGDLSLDPRVRALFNKAALPDEKKAAKPAPTAPEPAAGDTL